MIDGLLAKLGLVRRSRIENFLHRRLSSYRNVSGDNFDSGLVAGAKFAYKNILEFILTYRR